MSDELKGCPVAGLDIDELREEVGRLRRTRDRLLMAWEVNEQRETICRQCGELKIYPRGLEPYCENCGWPEENRSDNEIGNISPTESALQTRAEELEAHFGIIKGFLDNQHEFSTAHFLVMAVENIVAKALSPGEEK